MAKRKNAAAVALGKRGARARIKKLSPEQRSEIARKAGLAGGRGRAKNAELSKPVAGREPQAQSEPR
jgi:hypothetical protein